MLFGVVAIIGGVVALAWAADQFVVGAARVALIRDVPALVVGVVIVGFGTSTPELLVSGLAVLDDNPAVAIGNVVGSNLANLTLLLGVGALLVPLSVESRTVRLEAPLVLASTVAFGLAVQDGIRLWEGLALVGALGVVLVVIARRSGSTAPEPDVVLGEVEDFADVAHHRFGVELRRTLLGLVGTIGAAQLLLWGALRVADETGLSGGFVGVTLVAVGTSLPELVTVVQSARRRQTDLIVGNLLGSNLFNALAVGGLIGILGAPGVDDRSLTVVATGAAIAAAAVAGFVMATRRTVTRTEGAFLVVAYCATIPWLN